MAESCRTWWRNCALETDSEIRVIDRLEDALAPLSPNVKGIRGLISTLELCHHKADRWVYNIIEAIGAGGTNKGLGSRSANQSHDIETVWQHACAVLISWYAGCPAGSFDMAVDTVPAAELLACIGERTPLKEWQVQRVIERIRSLIHWPQSQNDPAAQYEWLLLSVGEYESAYLSRCPEHYREHEDFWDETVRTIVHDTCDGHKAELSLALAIDMLWPCHWNFVENLQIVLDAIGGTLYPAKSFAACGRNISLLPIRNRMMNISRTLNVFCDDSEPDKESDSQIPELLGKPTGEKRWLAASLDKTIRLQLDPPASLLELSALDGPAWIKQ